MTEEQLGFELPEFVRTLSRLHNGLDTVVIQRNPWVLVPGVSDHCRWLPLQELVSNGRVWNELLEVGDVPADNPEADDILVKQVWWSSSNASSSSCVVATAQYGAPSSTTTSPTRSSSVAARCLSRGASSHWSPMNFEPSFGRLLLPPA